jgi:hypothetical protein
VISAYARLQLPMATSRSPFYFPFIFQFRLVKNVENAAIPAFLELYC